VRRVLVRADAVVQRTKLRRSPQFKGFSAMLAGLRDLSLRRE
jgi:hypothetical protein